LKQTDFDGKYDYSKTEAVHTQGTAVSMLVYSPESRQIQITYALTLSQRGIVTVHDSKGVQVWSKSVSANEAATTQTIKLPVHASGLYVVSLQLDTQILTKKLIVP
jgi:hypothetical protein